MSAEPTPEPVGDAVPTDPANAARGPYCGRCGVPVGEGAHGACVSAAELEPPRYCPECARRLVVQVTPAGFSSRCSAHGVVASSA